VRRRAYFPEEYTSALASGSLLSASLQRRQPLVNVVDRESLRIEVVAQPLEEFFVLFMLGVADSFQQIVEAG
jgi:hypothetical protein